MESVCGKLNFGNQIEVIGKGKFVVQLKDGLPMNTSLMYFDVFYVPSLFWNLLSMGHLSEKALKS